MALHFWAEICMEAASLSQGPFPLCPRADEVGLIMTNLEKANQVSREWESPVEGRGGGGSRAGGGGVGHLAGLRLFGPKLFGLAQGPTTP